MKMALRIGGGLIVILVLFFVTLKVLDYWIEFLMLVPFFKGVDAQTPATFESTASIAHLKKSDFLAGVVDVARRLPAANLRFLAGQSIAPQEEIQFPFTFSAMEPPSSAPEPMGRAPTSRTLCI